MSKMNPADPSPGGPSASPGDPGASSQEIGKWVRLCSCGDDVIAAASLTIDARIRSVIQLLPPAAYRHEETPEHVHRLRVATRRALAALELYADCFCPKRGERMRSQMRRIRKVAGKARDLDVLTDRYEKADIGIPKKVIRKWKRLRKQCQEAIVELDVRLNSPG